MCSAKAAGNEGLAFLEIGSEVEAWMRTNPGLGKKPLWEARLNYKLDIFQKLGNGQLLWVKAIEGREEAHSELKHLAQTKPGEYFIYDAHKGCAIESAAAVRS